MPFNIASMPIEKLFIAQVKMYFVFKLCSLARFVCLALAVK